MKSIIPYLLVVCLCSGVVFNAMGQASSVQDSLLAKIEISIPPLNNLIDSALQHNALVNFRTLEIKAKEANLSSQRTYWLRNMGVQGDTRYGNIDAFSTNANGVSSNVLNSSTRQLNYAIGVYVKIPIYDLVNRKTQIKSATAELEQARYMATAQQDELRQLVIRQYYDLLLKQKLVGIRSLNLGSATANMEMIEKQFRNGVIPVAEYVRISDITARIQGDYEMAKSDFLLSKKILEELAGFSFGNF